ncbi:MAG: NUDIX domain-containing protein [bacterium]
MKPEALYKSGILKPEVGLFNVAVSAIIENSRGEILITRRSIHHIHRPGEWELVTGRINQGETDMIEALKREVEEEVGLRVDVIAPYRTFYFEHGVDKKPHFGVNFYCSCPDDQKIVLGKHEEGEQEQDAYKWVLPQEALTAIQDANVREAVLAYQEFRRHFS